MMLEHIRPYRIKTNRGNTYVIGAISSLHAEGLILFWYNEVPIKVQRIPTPPRHKPNSIYPKGMAL